MSRIPLHISFLHGTAGWSHIAAVHLYPDEEQLPRESFGAALAALDDGSADIAVIPVTNVIAGPVEGSVKLLKNASYAVVQEYWQPIAHCLVALPSARLDTLRIAHSHIQALTQCTNSIRAMGLAMVEESNTAVAAQKIAQGGDITRAAIASSEAAKLYGLQVLKDHFEDKANNRTLFLALTKAANENGAPVQQVLKRLKLG